MQTFMIQAIYGEQFEDIYVEAETVEAAIEAARAVSVLYHPGRLGRAWDRFVAQLLHGTPGDPSVNVYLTRYIEPAPRCLNAIRWSSGSAALRCEDLRLDAPARRSVR